MHNETKKLRWRSPSRAIYNTKFQQSPIGAAIGRGRKASSRIFAVGRPNVENMPTIVLLSSRWENEFPTPRSWQAKRTSKRLPKTAGIIPSALHGWPHATWWAMGCARPLSPGSSLEWWGRSRTDSGKQGGKQVIKSATSWLIIPWVINVFFTTNTREQHPNLETVPNRNESTLPWIRWCHSCHGHQSGSHLQQGLSDE